MFSHFTGKMNIELSFLVDGHVYKAVLHKEKSCTEERQTKHILNTVSNKVFLQVKRSELVTISLFEQDKSILLKSYSELGQPSVLR